MTLKDTLSIVVHQHVFLIDVYTFAPFISETELTRHPAGGMSPSCTGFIQE